MTWAFSKIMPQVKKRRMTKAERRIGDFSLGMKSLSENSRNYIHKLVHELFRIEKLSACSLLAKKKTGSGRNNISTNTEE